MEIIKGQASNRHIHLSQAGADFLFGPSGHVPKRKRWLGIGDCYASDTTLMVQTPTGMLELRLLLPYRQTSQVELLESDCWFPPCFRDSGDTLGAPLLVVYFRGVCLWVPAIVAKPHVHAPLDWRPGATYISTLGFRPTIRRSADCTEPVLHINADDAERMGWKPRVDNRVEIY